jgi:hypothetical protein
MKFLRQFRVKTGGLIWRAGLSLLVLLGAGPAMADIPAIPEPGLVMYGAVATTNTAGGGPLASGSIKWTVTGNSSSSSVSSMIVGVNGQFFYIARLPFETRQLGTTSFATTENTLAFTAAGATYARAATVNGNRAAISFSSSGHLAAFPFGAANRGSVERVDLLVSTGTAAETFSQWALRIFGTASVDPNADPDGDGMTNYQEYLAGTNPLDKTSALAIYDIRPDPRGGIVISWQSAANKTYSVLRSTNLDKAFAPLRTGIAASPSTTEFYDATAVGPGDYFYRIELETP